jgi:hypothetical protein
VNFQDGFYIRFVRTGGFAGMTNEVELKSDTLSVDEQKVLLKLISESNFFDQEFNKDSLKARDQYNYEITVEMKDIKRTVNIGETEIPENLRRVIDYLQRMVRTHRK